MQSYANILNLTGVKTPASLSRLVYDPEDRARVQDLLLGPIPLGECPEENREKIHIRVRDLVNIAWAKEGAEKVLLPAFGGSPVYLIAPLAEALKALGLTPLYLITHSGGVPCCCPHCCHHHHHHLIHSCGCNNNNNGGGDDLGQSFVGFLPA